MTFWHLNEIFCIISKIDFHNPPPPPQTKVKDNTFVPNFQIKANQDVSRLETLNKNANIKTLKIYVGVQGVSNL